MEMQQQIEKFFAAYEKRFNQALKDPPKIDSDGVVRSFAAYFVESSPVGVQGGKNGWMFRKVIPRGFKHYKKIGTHLMKVASLKVTELNDVHAMAKVRWHSVYRKKNGAEETIDFDVIYLLPHAHRTHPEDIRVHHWR